MKKLCAWLSEKEGRQGWISYSGHGAQVPDDEIQKVGYSEEKDGMDEAMVNIDYQAASSPCLATPTLHPPLKRTATQETDSL